MWEYARYISSGMKMKEEEEAQLEGKNILCTDYMCDCSYNPVETYYMDI